MPSSPGSPSVVGRPVVEDPYGDDSQDDQFEETTTSSPIRDVGAGPPPYPCGAPGQVATGALSARYMANQRREAKERAERMAAVGGGGGGGGGTV